MAAPGQWQVRRRPDEVGSFSGGSVMPVLLAAILFLPIVFFADLQPLERGLATCRPEALRLPGRADRHRARARFGSATGAPPGPER